MNLYFTDSVNVGNTVSSGAASALSGTHGQGLQQYWLNSISAYYDMTSSASAATRYGNILKPDFDSGFVEFGDLEPFKGNLYQLCPTIPNQPKFIDLTTGEWHSVTVFGPTTYDSTDTASFQPIGFDVDTGTAHSEEPFLEKCISSTLGVPKSVLDEAPEGSSGPQAYR